MFGATKAKIMKTNNAALLKWIDEVKALVNPDQVKWCDGSETEYDEMCNMRVQ